MMKTEEKIAIIQDELKRFKVTKAACDSCIPQELIDCHEELIEDLNRLKGINNVWHKNEPMESVDINGEHLQETYDFLHKSIKELEKVKEFARLCLTKYIPFEVLSPRVWTSEEEWLKEMNYDYYIYIRDYICEYGVSDDRVLTLEEFNLVCEFLKEGIK